MTKIVLVGSACVLLAAGSAQGDGPKPLTFGDVIELARASSPAARLADADVDVARGRRAGARVLPADNPVLEGGIGSRWGDERTTDREVSVSFPLELGGKRGKRVAAADADVGVAQARATDVRRVAVGRAAAGYFAVLFAQEAVALAEERTALAHKIVETANERKRAGDAAGFEVSLAEGELSRSKSGVAAAQRRLATARTRLAATLGLPSMDGVAITGQLDDRRFVTLDARSGGVTDRSDVRAARAHVVAASADVALADTARWPALSFRVMYAHEESADIAFGALAITLPVFQRGQGKRAQARAERHRAELELEATETLAGSEREGARAAYVAAVDAVTEMKDRAVPLAIENERMARESYAAGKIELAAMLVVRREALDTRAEYLARLLEAALAAVDLWVAQGAPA